jgi:hypothetical protein
LRVEKDSDLLYSIGSKKIPSGKEDDKSRFLVFFRVDKMLLLVGEGQ